MSPKKWDKAEYDLDGKEKLNPYLRAFYPEVQSYDKVGEMLGSLFVTRYNDASYLQLVPYHIYCIHIMQYWLNKYTEKIKQATVFQSILNQNKLYQNESKKFVLTDQSIKVKDLFRLPGVDSELIKQAVQALDMFPETENGFFDQNLSVQSLISKFEEALGNPYLPMVMIDFMEAGFMNEKQAQNMLYGIFMEHENRENLDSAYSPWKNEKQMFYLKKVLILLKVLHIDGNQAANIQKECSTVLSNPSKVIYMLCEHYPSSYAQVEEILMNQFDISKVLVHLEKLSKTAVFCEKRNELQEKNFYTLFSFWGVPEEAYRYKDVSTFPALAEKYCLPNDFLQIVGRCNMCLTPQILQAAFRVFIQYKQSVPVQRRMALACAGRIDVDPLDAIFNMDERLVELNDIVSPSFETYSSISWGASHSLVTPKNVVDHFQPGVFENYSKLCCQNDRIVPFFPYFAELLEAYAERKCKKAIASMLPEAKGTLKEWLKSFTYPIDALFTIYLLYKESHLQAQHKDQWTDATVNSSPREGLLEHLLQTNAEETLNAIREYSFPSNKVDILVNAVESGALKFQQIEQVIWLEYFSVCHRFRYEILQEKCSPKQMGRMLKKKIADLSWHPGKSGNLSLIFAKDDMEILLKKQDQDEEAYQVKYFQFPFFNLQEIIWISSLCDIVSKGLFHQNLGNLDMNPATQYQCLSFLFSLVDRGDLEIDHFADLYQDAKKNLFDVDHVELQVEAWKIMGMGTEAWNTSKQDVFCENIQATKEMKIFFDQLKRSAGQNKKRERIPLHQMVSPNSKLLNVRNAAVVPLLGAKVRRV